MTRRYCVANVERVGGDRRLGYFLGVPRPGKTDVFVQGAKQQPVETEMDLGI